MKLLLRRAPWEQRPLAIALAANGWTMIRGHYRARTAVQLDLQNAMWAARQVLAPSAAVQLWAALWVLEVAQGAAATSRSRGSGPSFGSRGSVGAYVSIIIIPTFLRRKFTTQMLRLMIRFGGNNLASSERRPCPTPRLRSKPLC